MPITLDEFDNHETKEFRVDEEFRGKGRRRVPHDLDPPGDPKDTARKANYDKSNRCEPEPPSQFCYFGSLA